MNAPVSRIDRVTGLPARRPATGQVARSRAELNGRV